MEALEGETEDPCDDVDGYIHDKMSDCMKVARRVQKLDTSTARAQCSKQLDQLEKELDKICREKGKHREEEERWLDIAKQQEREGEEPDLEDPLVAALWRAFQHGEEPPPGTRVRRR